MRQFHTIFIFFVFAFTPVFFVHAATVSIDPQKGSFGPGDTFVLTVRLDLGLDECVNAATVELVYPKDLVNASAVSKGESLLTLWPSEPMVDQAQGLVSFSGGIPGGYCGRVQGDPGKTNILAKIVFSIPGTPVSKMASGPVSLDMTFGANTQVLLNDGFGTPAPLTFIGGAYMRTLTNSGASNEWLDIVHADTTPPDIFTATISQDPKTFQGKYFLVFSAIDKQSGVHHFEVQEDDPKRFGYIRGKYEKTSFVNATSPYVLRDQELGSRIIVRAIDHAGNVQEAIVAPKGENTMTKASGGRVSSSWWYALGGLVLLLVIAVFVYIFRKKAPPVSEV